MPKRINHTEFKCKKCGRDTKPLFNIERYCPDCEGDPRIKGTDGPYGFKIIDVDYVDLIEIGSDKDKDEITQPMMKPIKKGMI